MNSTPEAVQSTGEVINDIAFIYLIHTKESLSVLDGCNVAQLV